MVVVNDDALTARTKYRKKKIEVKKRGSSGMSARWRVGLIFTIIYVIMIILRRVGPNIPTSVQVCSL